MSEYSTSFWLPDFSFSPEKAHELTTFAEGLGIENPGKFLHQIEHACQMYLGAAGNNAKHLPQGNINKQLIELGRCAKTMAEILKNAEVLAELKYKSQDECLQWRLANPEFLDQLQENMQILEEITATTPVPSRGKPKGAGVDHAGWALAGALCKALLLHGIKPRRINTEGKAVGEAHQLLSIIRGPLGLGLVDLEGTLSRIISVMY